MSSRVSAVRNLTIAIAVIVVLLAAYFFPYVQRRERLLTEHHLRLLSNSGEYASDALRCLVTNVRNAISVGRGEIGGPSSRRAIVAAINDKCGLIRGISTLSLAPTDLPPFLGTPASAGYSAPPADDRPRTDLAVVLDPSTPRLVLLARRGDLRDTTLTWQASLDGLLGETLETAAGGDESDDESFTEVLLVRSNGDVLVENGRSHLHINRLSIPKSSRVGQDSSASSLLLPTSQTYDVPIAGESYKLFLQPLRVPILVNSRGAKAGDTWQLEDEWFVAGLLPARQFRSMSMEISPTIVLAAVWLIAMGLFSLPLLKIHFMGAREELQFRDLGLLAFAIVLGASLYTFACMYLVLHEKEARRTEDALDNLSAAVSSQLDRELGELDTALVAVTRRRLSQEHRDRGRAAARSPYRDLLAEDGGPLGCAPFMEMLYWIDSRGLQVSKWSIRSTPTPLVKVNERTYFTEPTRGLVWRAPSWDTLYENGRYVQSIRSITTGLESAVLSRVRRADRDRDTLGAIESRLRSVIAPVLPPGMGFAIIDDAGLVQFHSQSVRNVREHFFRELGSNQGIRSAVAARSPALARTTYGIVPCVLQASPVKDTPWSLVVFEDSRMPRRVLVTILGMSFGVYGVYLVVLLLSSLLVFSSWRARPLLGERRRLWYWPTEADRLVYRRLLVVFAACLIVWFAILLVGNEWGIVILGLTTPPATLLLLRGGFQRRRAPAPLSDAGTSHRWLFPSLVTAIVLLLGVLPALGAFRVVHDEIQTQVLGDEEVGFVRSVTDHVLDRLRWYERVHFSPENRRRVRESICGTSPADDPIGFYKPGGWSWTWVPSGANDACSTGVRLPVTGALRAALTRVGFPGMTSPPRATAGSGPGPWVQRHDTLAFVAQEPMAEGTLGGDVTTPAPRAPNALRVSARVVGLDLAGSLWFWLLGAIGLVVLFLVVRLSVHDAFLGRFICTPPLDARTIGGPVKRAILLRRPVPKEWVMDAHVISAWDVRRAKSAAALVRMFRRSGRKVVLLRDFDVGLKEPGIIGKRLELIEALNAENPERIYVESTIEPLHFLTARIQERYSERHELGIAVERWAAALEGYIRVRQEPDKDLEAVGTGGEWTFEETLRTECAALKAVGFEASVHEALRQTSAGDPEKVIEAVADVAKAHYRRLWTSCSSEEKLLLYRIAKEGVVGRRAENVFASLKRRGLVEWPCRLMNESFRRFVLTAERAETLAKWQERGDRSTWAKLRAPLLLTLGAPAFFFFATQKEALSQTLGLLAALTAVLPGIVSVWGSVRRGRGSSDEPKAGESAKPEAASP